MSIKTSNTDFKTRIRQQIERSDHAQSGGKRAAAYWGKSAKMVDELGHWEEWRDRAAQIRDHVLSNLDAYLYQLSEKVTQTEVTSILQKPKKTPPATFYRLPNAKMPGRW